MTIASVESGSSKAVRAGALSAFAELGYHGTSVREIARRAGTSVAALYHYYPSKELILAGLVDTYLDELLTSLTRADREAGEAAPDRLSAIVQCHVSFHLANSAEGRVCNAELHRLSPAMRATSIEKRRSERALFESAVSAGVDQGCFAVPNLEAAARAVFEMCTAVLDLYDVATDVNHLAATYAELALNVVGYVPPTERAED